MISRSQLKFHETFQPDLRHISQILELARDGFGGTKFEISDTTGIPTGQQKGKVEPAIKYAAYMGLIAFTYTKGFYQLALTPLGAEVYAQDRYLHENLTAWICHCAMTHPINGAPQWAFLANQAPHPFYDSISTEMLHKQATAYFEVAVDVEELFGVVRRCYTDGCFAQLQYLEWENNTLRFVQQNERTERTYVYAYFLLQLWQDLLPQEQEITMDDLTDVLHFDAVFGLDMEELGDVLDTLRDANYIAINRQLFPVTLVKQDTAAHVLPLLYSNLI